MRFFKFILAIRVFEQQAIFHFIKRIWRIEQQSIGSIIIVIGFLQGNEADVLRKFICILLRKRNVGLLGFFRERNTGIADVELDARRQPSRCSRTQHESSRGFLARTYEHFQGVPSFVQRLFCSVIAEGRTDERAFVYCEPRSWGSDFSDARQFDK